MHFALHILLLHSFNIFFAALQLHIYGIISQSCVLLSLLNTSLMMGETCSRLAVWLYILLYWNVVQFLE